MAERDLQWLTNDELYAFKDRLDALRDEVKGRRGPGPTHTRDYCRIMRQKINDILKERDAPLRRPDSHQRMYGPGNASWQKDASQ